MILGMSTSAFTLVHALLGLAEIFAGFVILIGLMMAKRLNGWTALFLASAALTTLTGFLFPISQFTPALGVGVLSLAALAAAILGLYVFRFVGSWRWIYVVGAVLALYPNVFVAIVQAAFRELRFCRRRRRHSPSRALSSRNWSLWRSSWCLAPSLSSGSAPVPVLPVTRAYPRRPRGIAS